MQQIRPGSPEAPKRGSLHIPPVLQEGEKLTESSVPSETFSFFEDMLNNEGFTEHTDVAGAYKEIESRQYIVRREDPKNILKLLSEEESYDVHFGNEERYSNCVEWNPSDGSKNLQNSYLEGRTHMNGLVAVVGFEKTDEDDLVTLDDASSNHYGIDRSGVRSYKGAITRDRVSFINLRMPGHLLPERYLTEDELDAVDEYTDAKDQGKNMPPVMIHRVFIADKKEEKKMAA